MWHDIFFDQNSNFQWSSIAAFISFLAFCTSIVSIRMTKNQGTKNRKSSTLAILRIEELKEVRLKTAEINTLIRSLIEEGEKFKGTNQIGTETKNEIRSRIDVIISLLYRTTPHGEKFLEQLRLHHNGLKSGLSLFMMGELASDFETNAKIYSEIEYQEIEKYI